VPDRDAHWYLELVTKHQRPVTLAFIARVWRGPRRAVLRLSPPTLGDALRELRRHNDDSAYWNAHRNSRRRWSKRLFDLYASTRFALDVMRYSDKKERFKELYEAICPGRRPRTIKK
jgi:hypothetical protein